jgi:hypothetical protein
MSDVDCIRDRCCLAAPVMVTEDGDPQEEDSDSEQRRNRSFGGRARMAGAFLIVSADRPDGCEVRVDRGSGA